MSSFARDAPEHEMQIWTFLHIVAMFGAVMVTVGGALMATWAIRRRDLEALRTYFRMAPRIDAIGGLLYLAGIALGFINAWSSRSHEGELGSVAVRVGTMI